MSVRVQVVLIAAFLPGVCGCITIVLPEDVSLLSGGTSMVLRGEAASVEQNGSCFVWTADDGRTFVLFQDPDVTNVDFDTVVTPGSTSRLQLVVQDDLGDPCREDAIVAEVKEVLELNGEDLNQGGGILP